MTFAMRFSLFCGIPCLNAGNPAFFWSCRAYWRPTSIVYWTFQSLSSCIIGKTKDFMKNLDFSERIKYLLKELGLTQAALGAKLGLSQGVISEFTSGMREPSKEFIFGLSKHGISVDWFLTGKGDMLFNNMPLAQSGQEVAKNETGFTVPLLHQKVSCGPGANWQDDSDMVDYIDVFNLLPHLKAKRLFALRVDGASMIGAGIRNGDYVLFDSAKDQRFHDGIYALVLDDEVYCKRLEFDGISRKIKIYSVRVADLEKAELLTTIDMGDMSAAERLIILGRVLYWVHPNIGDD
jgi:SOS-response transcriptional repressor LexA